MASEQWAAAETCRDLVEDRAWLKTLALPSRVRERRRRGESPSRWSARTRSRCPASASTCGCSATRSPARRAARRSAAPARPAARAPVARAAAARGGDTLASPLQGNVFKVLVEQGATVEEGALVCIIEAMKMENEITAHKAGVIAELPISEGAAVTRRRHAGRDQVPRLGGELRPRCTKRRMAAYVQARRWISGSPSSPTASTGSSTPSSCTRSERHAIRSRCGARAGASSSSIAGCTRSVIGG